MFLSFLFNLTSVYWWKFPDWCLSLVCTHRQDTTKLPQCTFSEGSREAAVIVSVLLLHWGCQFMLTMWWFLVWDALGLLGLLVLFVVEKHLKTPFLQPLFSWAVPACNKSSIDTTWVIGQNSEEKWAENTFKCSLIKRYSLFCHPFSPAHLPGSDKFSISTYRIIQQTEISCISLSIFFHWRFNIALYRLKGTDR